MCTRSEKEKDNKARILMFSQRNIYEKLHYRCSSYEFEDIIHEIDSVDLLAPQPNKWFKYGTRIAGRIAKDYAIALNPGIPNIRLRKNYDVFFVVCHFAKDLLHVKSVEGWRDHCKTAICWLNEIWLSDMYKERCFLKLLSKFDHVIINCSQSVTAVNEIIRGECVYLPPGIDAILFCPYPKLLPRLIDVYSIGRRLEETHQTLLRMAENNEIFYVYDTIDGKQVINPNQHRVLLANMAKRSKYFIVNPGKIDSPEETNRQSEIGYRYFEGAASGTIMIGETPKNEQFAKVFDWTDAVIHLPFGSDKIDKIINELDKQPQRQAEIRKNNVIQSLLRHDWAYRWKQILNIAGLKPTPELENREKRLQQMAEQIGNAK